MIKRTVLKNSILGLCVFTAFFSFSYAQNLPLGLPSCTTSYNQVLSEMLANNSPKTVKGIISTFCAQTTIMPGCAEDENTFYLPKDSVFLSLLCKQTGSENLRNTLFNPQFTEGEDTYFLNSRFLKRWKLTKNCTPVSSNDFSKCDMQSFLSSLFDTVLNDYFSLRQALVYGAKDAETDEEKQANIFSQDYYMLNMCDEVTNNYPKTCKTLKKYISAGKSLFDQTDIINLAGLKKNKNEAVCDLTKTSPLEYDFVYCGLYNESTTSLNTFIDLVYNEFFWYRLFMAYYSPLILSQPKDFYPDKVKDPNDTSEITNDIDDIITMVQRSQMAVDLSFRILRERRNTFPLHIGFLMYQEDVNRFMKAMAKIYTPFVTLHDKFINVQKKE